MNNDMIDNLSTKLTELSVNLEKVIEQNNKHISRLEKRNNYLMGFFLGVCGASIIIIIKNFFF